MIDLGQLVATIEAGLAFLDTSLIVRAPGAIAELHGPLTVRSGKEWLTIGEESGSHVHLRLDDIRAVRYCESGKANAALEVLGPDASVLCRVSFRGTNPERTEKYHPDRAGVLRTRFSHLATEAAG